MIENEILLTTPDYSFDLVIKRQGGGLAYEIRKCGEPEAREDRKFSYAEDAARYLYERGCSCAHEMISLGLQALD